MDNRKAAIEAAMKAGKALFAGDKKAALAEGVNAVKLFIAKPPPAGSTEASQVMEIKATLADVIQFSGCRDDQTSADAQIGGKPSGACSWAFIEAFNNKGMNVDYVTLLGEIRNLLQGKYSQVPQMSCGRKLNLKTQFIM